MSDATTSRAARANLQTLTGAVRALANEALDVVDSAGGAGRLVMLTVAGNPQASPKKLQSCARAITRIANARNNAFSPADVPALLALVGKVKGVGDIARASAAAEQRGASPIDVAWIGTSMLISNLTAERAQGEFALLPPVTRARYEQHLEPIGPLKPRGSHAGNVFSEFHVYGPDYRTAVDADLYAPTLAEHIDRLVTFAQRPGNALRAPNGNNYAYDVGTDRFVPVVHDAAANQWTPVRDAAAKV